MLVAVIAFSWLWNFIILSKLFRCFGFKERIVSKKVELKKKKPKKPILSFPKVTVEIYIATVF